MSGNLQKAFAVQNMLKARKIAKTIINRSLATTIVRCGGGGASHGGEVELLPIKTRIGKREVVGFGMNGEPSYVDHLTYPFPAIRFKEDTPEILKIKEKEKGDWKKLTIEEKKALYRASFCQTYAEQQAPTGEWKAIFGTYFAVISVAFWMMIWVKMVVYKPLPTTVTDEQHVRDQIKRHIDARAGPISGLASRYDYEKNDWKPEYKN